MFVFGSPKDICAFCNLFFDPRFGVVGFGHMKDLGESFSKLVLKSQSSKMSIAVDMSKVFDVPKPECSLF